MKEYLLLRNNVQSGPYSLTEIKDMGLKAFDLIWVEKKSFSWRYPSEINELMAFAPPVEPTLERAADRTVSGAPVTKVNTVTNAAPVVAEPVEAITAATEIITETPPAVVKSIKHVVAFKPHVDNIDIKTIKSHHQPNVVKVQVREKDYVAENQPAKQVENETAFVRADFIEATAEKSLPLLYEAEPLPEKQSIYHGMSAQANVVMPGQNHATSNKLEIVVLLVGALSLLAVAYLLFTSNY